MQAPMSIAQQLAQFNASLPAQVRLVAVSKTHPNEAILEAYATGQRIFGENKVQELERKAKELPADIQWHFIGHLQTNKVKYIAPYVSLIHGIDSLKLLKTVNKEAQKNERTIDCLLQLHIATEETKFGLSHAEAEALLAHPEFAQLQHVRIVGLMGMASFTPDAAQVRSEFASLRQSFERLRQQFFAQQSSFCELSMGMSDDYRTAIEQGSTLVRIGTAIFGSRHYTSPEN